MESKNNSEIYSRKPNYQLKMVTISLIIFGILNFTEVEANTKKHYRYWTKKERRKAYPFAPIPGKYKPHQGLFDFDITGPNNYHGRGGNNNTGGGSKGDSVSTPPPQPKDSDKDGIVDNIDQCPYEFGLKNFQGCPDTDGDGIPDSGDLCPDTPKNMKVDGYGCPIDSDGDGYVDEVDQCPDEYGPLEYLGCPTPDEIDSIIPQDTIVPIIEEDYTIPRGKDINFTHNISGSKCQIRAYANFPGETIKYMILLDEKNKICFFLNGGSATFDVDPDKEYHLQVVPYVEARGKKQRVSNRIIIKKQE